MKRESQQVAGGQFLLVEIDTGKTFAHIAQSTGSTKSEKFVRNLKNARKAYDTAMRFRRTTVLDVDEKVAVDAKLKELRTLLQELGEKV